MPRHILIVLYALLQTAAAAAAAAETSPLPAPDYTVSRSWPLGGPGGWDYLALEASGGRLFISRGDRVDVIETVSGKLAGRIANTAGVHGIAFAPALTRGYTSNGRSDTISVFELDTLRVLQEVPVSGRKPDAILYEPRHDYVITANGESANLSVFDARTLQVAATIALAGPPEFMATDAAGMVYVNIETEPGKLAAVDTKTLTVKATWPLPGCDSPTRSGDRRGASSPVLGLRKPGHGGHGFCVRQADRAGGDRQGAGRGGVRRGFGSGVQLQRAGRHIDGDS